MAASRTIRARPEARSRRKASTAPRSSDTAVRRGARAVGRPAGGKRRTALRCDGSTDSALRLILAHGAGAGMDSPFLRDFAEGLADRGVYVVRFEFPYMAARRRGARPPPDRAEVLMQIWREVVAEVGHPARTYIGGKSMGGRIASMVADELGVRGLVCLGYPFHPPAQPDKLRTAHLAELRTPTLIVQGTRDTFGTEAEIAGYRLSEAIQLRFLPDGDHSLVPRRASGHTRAEHFAAALDAVTQFLRGPQAFPDVAPDDRPSESRRTPRTPQNAKLRESE